MKDIVSASSRMASTHKGIIQISTKSGTQSFSIPLPGYIDQVAENTASYLANKAGGAVESITLDGLEAES